MKKDTLYSKRKDTISDFEFNHKVADVFDDMISRSVPFYKEQQIMFRNIAKEFFVRSTCVYDLGCSTGTTLIDFCRHIEQPATFVGYDNSLPMLEKAKKKIKQYKLGDYIELELKDLNKGGSDIKLDNASVITML